MRSRARLGHLGRLVVPLVLVTVASTRVAAQDAAAAPEASILSSEGSAASPEGSASTMEADAPRDAELRVAVVLVGDPNAEARAVAERVEAALRDALTLPSDPALRASLVGETGEATIAPIVRDRRALGGSEREDLPLLASLGDRADVVVLLVVRARAGARELVAFDVRHRGFFEGTLALDGTLEAARVVRFVRARARAALRDDAVQAPDEPTALEQHASDVIRDGAGATDEGEQPEWIEVNWPYLLAAGLLAGAAAFVIVYTTSGSDPVPMLRFRPGGSP